MSEPRSFKEIFLDGFTKNDPFITEHFQIVSVTVPEPKSFWCADCDHVSATAACVGCGKNGVEVGNDGRPVLPLGVPYAQQGIFHGRLYQQCPVCDVRVFEDTDEQGERESNNYAKHYEEEHT